jgi:hypothetical protein
MEMYQVASYGVQALMLDAHNALLEKVKGRNWEHQAGCSHICIHQASLLVGIASAGAVD